MRTSPQRWDSCSGPDPAGKNTFIVSTTLASRTAIRGGLTVEDAMQLSDVYIQKCEFLNSPDRIINLQYHMILDFTDQVNTIRGGKNTSKLIHAEKIDKAKNCFAIPINHFLPSVRIWDFPHKAIFHVYSKVYCQKSQQLQI